MSAQEICHPFFFLCVPTILCIYVKGTPKYNSRTTFHCKFMDPLILVYFCLALFCSPTLKKIHRKPYFAYTIIVWRHNISYFCLCILYVRIFSIHIYTFPDFHLPLTSQQPPIFLKFSNNIFFIIYSF